MWRRNVWRRNFRNASLIYWSAVKWESEKSAWLKKKHCPPTKRQCGDKYARSKLYVRAEYKNISEFRECWSVGQYFVVFIRSCHSNVAAPANRNCTIARVHAIFDVAARDHALLIYHLIVQRMGYQSIRTRAHSIITPTEYPIYPCTQIQRQRVLNIRMLSFSFDRPTHRQHHFGLSNFMYKM